MMIKAAVAVKVIMMITDFKAASLYVPSVLVLLQYFFIL